MPRVSWFTDRRLFLIAVVLYGVSTLFAMLGWRRNFREDQRALYMLLGAGLIFHTLAMVARGFSLQRCPINNLYEATLFLTWTTGITYAVLGGFHRLRFLGVFVAPLLLVVGVFALMPALDVRTGRREFSHGWESLHAAFILLAYGAFGLGALAAVAYLLQAHNLRFHKARALMAKLPPITRLESVTSGLLLAGLILLSGGLVAGGFYLKSARGSFVSTDPFVLYAGFTWCLYLGLVAARWMFGQRGRRLAYAVVGSFAFVLLTFWGVFLLSGLHAPATAGPGSQRESGTGFQPGGRPVVLASQLPR